jgi:hypothetical protein
VFHEQPGKTGGVVHAMIKSRTDPEWSRAVAFAALRISKDAIVNGIGFEFKLSSYVLHNQRDRYLMT